MYADSKLKIKDFANFLTEKAIKLIYVLHLLVNGEYALKKVYFHYV